MKSEEGQSRIARAERAKCEALEGQPMKAGAAGRCCFNWQSGDRQGSILDNNAQPLRSEVLLVLLLVIVLDLDFLIVSGFLFGPR